MIPDQVQVRQIFNESYNVFYKKWINPNTPFDVDAMMREAHELDKKYNHQDIVNINALIECIEDEWRKRNAISSN